MKALLVVTGRGLGGDAAIALNLIKTLEKRELNAKLLLMNQLRGYCLKKMDIHGIRFPFLRQEVMQLQN